MNERNEEAEKLKAEGNKFFTQNNFKLAIEQYTKAIELDSSSKASAFYFSNRALCYLKTEDYFLAVLDTDNAILKDPTLTKAYYRRGIAHFALRKLSNSLSDFKRAKSLEPNNEDISNKFEMVFKEHKLKLFSESIERKNLIDTIKIDEIIIDKSYEGPFLESIELINHEFIIKLMNYLKNEKIFYRKFVYMILIYLKKYFETQPTVIDINNELDETITVCGDIHGQFYDLLHIFEINGYPSKSNKYLFNGDFVDRGSFSVEVIITLLCWKCLYCNSFFLARGNHKNKAMNAIYGFKGEVKAKYDETTYTFFSELFNTLPLVHIISDKIFVVHGGLPSKDNVTLDDIRQINRFKDIPEEGDMCDLLWSDATNDNGRPISMRGVSKMYGPDIVETFLKDNNLEFIIRSHEVKDEGYELQKGWKTITVFSAPNYCDQMKNKGAYIKFKGNDTSPQFYKFEFSDHPKKPAMAYAAPFLHF